MKKLLFVMLFLSMSATAQNTQNIQVEIKCIGGYNYLYSWVGNGKELSGVKYLNVNQMYELTTSTNPLGRPVRCK